MEDARLQRLGTEAGAMVVVIAADDDEATVHMPEADALAA